MPDPPHQSQRHGPRDQGRRAASRGGGPPTPGAPTSARAGGSGGCWRDSHDCSPASVLGTSSSNWQPCWVGTGTLSPRAGPTRTADPVDLPSPRRSSGATGRGRAVPHGMRDGPAVCDTQLGLSGRHSSVGHTPWEATRLKNLLASHSRRPSVVPSVSHQLDTEGATNPSHSHPVAMGGFVYPGTCQPARRPPSSPPKATSAELRGHRRFSTR